MNSLRISIIAAVCAALMLSACGPAPQTATPTATLAPAPTLPPTAVPATPVPSTPTVAGPYGPTNFPANVNPLTGKQVADPAVLNRRPIIVKVSNQGPEVRPQSGLSLADHVWEYEMEGYALTRFSAIYLSQSPARVGSVRSARLIDVEQLMDMYGGILVYSGGSSNRHAPDTPPRTNELINKAPWVKRVVTQDYLPNVGASYNNPYFQLMDFPRPNIAEYHKLFAIPAEIWKLADEKGFNERPNLDGLFFNASPPAGGVATTSASIDYVGKGPKRVWDWDAASGRWVSSTEDQEMIMPLTPDTDSLTGEPLAFDNVIIIYSFHWDGDFIEDEEAQLPAVHINLDQDQWKYPAKIVLLRDGMRFEGTWERKFGDVMIKLLDASGNLMALKPGNVWWQSVSSNVAQPTVTFTP